MNAQVLAITRSAARLEAKDRDVVRVADEAVPALGQPPVEVVEVDVESSGLRGDPHRGPLLARLLHTVRHHVRFQIAADQLEHALVGDPPCDPRHQRVVFDSVKEAIEVQVDGPLMPFGEPKLRSEKPGSNTGVSTCERAC